MYRAFFVVDVTLTTYDDAIDVLRHHFRLMFSVCTYIIFTSKPNNVILIFCDDKLKDEDARHRGYARADGRYGRITCEQPGQ